MSSKSLIITGVIFSLLLVIVSYFFVSGGGNQQIKITSYSSTDKEKPKVEVKSYSSDVGTIKVSDKKEVEFSLKNIGNKPLQLFNVSSSCNCATGQITYEGNISKEFGMHSQSDLVAEVAPQKEAKVKVIYRPYIMPVYGFIEREVYVETNDPENLKLIFKIKTYVK